MPKDEEIVVEEPQKENESPIKDIGSSSLNAFVGPEKEDDKEKEAEQGDKSEAEKKAEEKKEDDGRATVINAIRENVLKNMRKVNSKSLSERHKMADAHRAQSRAIVTALDSRKKIAREQTMLDFELDYLSDKDLTREELENRIKDFLTNVKTDLTLASDAAKERGKLAIDVKEADAEKANSLSEAQKAQNVLSRSEAVRKRKAEENAKMAERLRSIAKANAKATDKKAEADGALKKTVDDAEAKKNEAQRDAKKDDDTAQRIVQNDQNNGEGEKKEEPVNPNPNPEMKEEPPVQEPKKEEEKKEENPNPEKGPEQEGQPNPEGNPKNEEQLNPEIIPQKEENPNPENQEKPPVQEPNPEIEKEEQPNPENQEPKKEEEKEPEKEPEKVEGLLDLDDEDALNKSFKEERDEDEDDDELIASILKKESDEVETKPAEPKDALTELGDSMAALEGIDPDIKPALAKDIAAFKALLDKVSPGGPNFSKIRSSSNRRKYKKNEDALKANKTEISKIETDWEKRVTDYGEDKVKEYNADYDSLAQTWYELTHQYAVSRLGPDATEEQILSALENRSIPEDSAKQVEQYVGLFDDVGIKSMLAKILNDPYMSFNSEDIPKEDAPEANTVLSENDHSVVHDKIAMYTAADSEGTRKKYLFDRTFVGTHVGYEASKEQTRGRKGRRRKKALDQRTVEEGLYYAAQVGLTSDAVDSSGRFIYSEFDPETISQLRRRYKIDASALEKYNDGERLKKNENLSNAIEKSIFFRHINALTIRFYSLYNAEEGNEGAQQPAEATPFNLAPGLSEFTKWALDKVSLETDVFTEHLAVLLGDPTFAKYPYFDFVLFRDTGIPSKEFLPDLTKIFMIINYYELSKIGDSPEEKELAESMARALFANIEPQKLKEAKLNDLFGFVKLTNGGNWRTTLTRIASTTLS